MEAGNSGDTPKKDQVKAFFAGYAADYAESYRRPTGDLDRLIALLKPEPKWEALDVAAGTGRIAKALRPRVSDVKAIDITPEMETEFKKSLREAGLADIPFIVGDAEHLPFEAGAFDAVTCARAAHHFPDVKQALSEMHRVLCPGGRVAVADMAAPDDADGARFLNRLEQMRDASHVRALGPGEWVELLWETGFRNITWVVFHEHLTFESWLSPVSPGAKREQAIRRAMASKEAGSSHVVVWEAGDLRFIKRRIVLVGTKAPAGR